MKTIDIIGAQMDLGAVRKGVDMGPLAIRHAGLIERLRDMGYDVVDHSDIIPLVAQGEGNIKMRYAREVNDTNERLFNKLKNCSGFPIVLGGDHSIAAGTITASLEKNNQVGVIWVDAHADFNDEEISPSGNMHGMPLSAVCGFGPNQMVSYSERRINPENVVIVGARSIDPLERIKLKEKKVSIFSISDIHTMGIQEVVKKAIEIASNHTNCIHLSFDMDALDPDDAPGVGTPVLNGLSAREAFITAELVSRSNKLSAIDLVETNPLLDERNKTGILACELILTCLGMTEYSQME